MTIDRDGAGIRRTKMIELFDLARRGIELELRYLVPGTVQAYIPEAADASLPAMVQVRIDFEAARPGREGDLDASVPERFKPVPGALAGEGELVGQIPLLTCPVEFCGPDGGWLRGPLAKGQTGLVAFTDRALGKWLAAVTLPTDPGEGATHGENLCDAFFRPGARNGKGTLAGSIPAEGVTLGTADPAALAQHLLHLGDPVTSLTTTAPTLTLDGATEVKVGAGAVDLLAKAEPVMQLWTLLKSAVSTWVPPIAPVIDNGAALKGLLAGFIAQADALIGQISTTKAKGE